MQSKVVFQKTKLTDEFNIKHPVEQQQKHELVYMVNCPSQSCNKTYIDETAIRLTTGVEENGGKCEQSNVTRHSVDSGHNIVQPSIFYNSYANLVQRLLL